ncbi:GGDEF domain-containing protein [Acuticoccus kandeliae]|uniref:GGDEF domain-containing protein n=1 Tax=Acuticoccus kandeliae TaxID=2073160 RepID=UPI000D3EA16A|nr:diguanylate cyclase [Acuticoccus kandeliae]
MAAVFYHLAQTAGILMLGAVLLGLVFDHAAGRARDLLVGATCGLLTAGLMAMPLPAEGYLIDGRGVFMIAVGFFGGPLGALAGIIAPLAMRVATGGPAVLVGVAAILVQVAIGTAFHIALKRDRSLFERRSILWLAAVSPLSILTLYVPYLAPGAGDPARIALALLAWLPAGTLLFGLATLNELSRSNVLRDKRRRARFDQSTALISRELFDAQLLQAWRLHNRYGSEYIYMLVAIDDVATLRKAYRGAEWERLVEEVARAVRQAVRNCDLCTRTDLDRFAVLLPHATLPFAHPIAERIAARVCKTVTPKKTAAGAITVSIGIADAASAELPYEVHARAEGELFLANARQAAGAIGPARLRRTPLRSFPGAIITLPDDVEAPPLPLPSPVNTDIAPMQGTAPEGRGRRTGEWSARGGSAPAAKEMTF